MGLNLTTVKQLVDSFFDENVKLNYSSEIQDGEYSLKSSGIKLGELDDDIFLRINVFDNGALNMRFIFDSLSKNRSAGLELINKFNIDCPWLKAFIDEGKGYLTVDYTVVNNIDEDEVVENVGFALGYVASDSFIDKIRALSCLTTSE